MKIRIGTRSSKLAVIQAGRVESSLRSFFPNMVVEIVKINTTGDKISDRPLYDIGGKALFLKEIEQALMEDNIDIAVHSMKDVPGDVIHPDLSFAAVLEREDPREVLVMKDTFLGLHNISENCIFGTSSMRRVAQLSIINPNLKFTHLRGNVNTRIDKVLQNQIQATLLAKAGIDRLGAFNSDYMHVMDAHSIIPAVGQGVIGAQAKKHNTRIVDMLVAINHQETWQMLQIERGFLEHLNADCKTPLASYARRETDSVHANFFLANPHNHLIYQKIHWKNIDTAQGYKTGVEAAKLLNAQINFPN